MFSIWNEHLAAVRDSTASEKPVATSGAISIISAVFACSLLRMAARISVKHLRSQRKRDLALVAADDLQRLSNELSQLADDDITAFQAFLHNQNNSMPASPKDERQNKSSQSMDVPEIISVPLSAARLIMQIYKHSIDLVPLCTKNLLVDIANASDHARSAQTSLLANLAANLQTNRIQSSLSYDQRRQLIREVKQLKKNAHSKLSMLNDFMTEQA